MTRYIVRRPFDYLNRRQVVGQEWVPRGHWKDEWLIARGFVIAVESDPAESTPAPEPTPKPKRKRRKKTRKRGR